MDDDSGELRNPFPSPPSHYTRYTSHNLDLLNLLKARTPEINEANQYEILSDQNDVPQWSLTQLEKPRVDWILEDPEAYYDVFGDRWFVKENIPSLAELGGNQLYPADSSIDRRPALQSVLRSLLVSYSSLTRSLLLPPPTSEHLPLEWQRLIEWINTLSQNLMAAANDLRPVQARGNLEVMMKRQLELRREETRNLHRTCDLMALKLGELSGTVEKMFKDAQTSVLLAKPAQMKKTSSDSDSRKLQNVLNWAEQV